MTSLRTYFTSRQAWKRFRAKYDPSEPRDDSGRWTVGAGIHAEAEKASKSWADRAKELPGEVWAAAKSKVKATYGKLEDRYGRPTAIAIMGAGVVGVPIPVPGASLVTAAPVIAAAELYRRFRGAKAYKDANSLTEATIRKLGKDWMDGLLKEWAAENKALLPGDRRVGEFDFNGIRVVIQQWPGDSTEGSSELRTPTAVNAYGEIPGTVGADAEPVDVFLENPTETPVSVDSDQAYIVNQLAQDGTFDEHKVMLGFASEDAARAAYLANYLPEWTGFGGCVPISYDALRDWLGTGNHGVAYTKGLAEGSGTAGGYTVPDDKPRTLATCARCGGVLKSDGDDTWCPDCRKGKALSGEPFPAATQWQADTKDVGAILQLAEPGCTAMVESAGQGADRTPDPRP